MKMPDATATRFFLRRRHASFQSDVPSTSSMAALLIPDPRIDPRVREIDEEVREEQEHAEENDHSQREVVVAVLRGVDEVGAGAGHVEDRLDDDRAGEERRRERA